MKNSKFIIVAVLVAIFMFILPGCENQLIEEESSQSSTVQSSVITDAKTKLQLDWMLKNNRISQSQFSDWHKNGVPFVSGSKDNSGGLLNDGYPPQNDIVFTQEHIQQLIDSEKTSKNARYRVSKLFSGGSFKIRIHANVTNSWRTAIGDAAIAWNNLGVNIVISTYPSTDNTYKNGELDIDYSSISPVGAVAYTSVPTSSSMNSYIKINSNFSDTYGGVSYNSSNTTANFKKAVMMHEIGHALGIQHTDSNEGTSYDIWYSPCNYGDDSNSIFRNASTNKYKYNTTTNPVFSNCDWYGIYSIWG